MAKIISISNQKGGVGKTTTAINLAASIGLKGKKTLIIDLDPQGNTTAGLGVDRRSVEVSSYDLLIKDIIIDKVILKTEFNNLDIVPSSIDLAAAELELIDFKQRESRLKSKLDKKKSEYDYIIIDCPPSLGLITTNAIFASSSILIPMQCEYYALEGLSQLMGTIKRMKKQNKNLELEGILMTMYDGRLNITQQVVDEVKKFFPGKVFNTVIHRGVRLSEAPSYGKPVYYYDKSCKGTAQYMALSDEIINKNEK